MRTSDAYNRWAHLARQLNGECPFSGTIVPSRVPALPVNGSRPTHPFPHPWNFTRPLDILETFFVGADAIEGSGRHNRYLDVPGFAPVLVTRDPTLIRAISTESGNKPGHFHRDTMPSAGIARATGEDSLLYANGDAWKHQKQISTPPFARTTLFQPERFNEFEETFRETAEHRLRALDERLAGSDGTLEVRLEPEIQAVMLEMLINNFFGADLPYEEIRERYVVSLERVIAHIVRDTVVHRFGGPLRMLPAFRSRVSEARAAKEDFERLTDIALASRAEGRGLWAQFESDAPDDALRSNIRVFLAGALEATTSYASWAVAHLARNRNAQARAHEEIRGITAYTPDTLKNASYFNAVLDETLRLTPALYFHPRRATSDRPIETRSGDTLAMPVGTHILLDVWHANRHEDHWGVGMTGHRADVFAPERWEAVSRCPHATHEFLHFGFGHGPRFCPGKHLGQLEVALVVGAIVKLFEFDAVNERIDARAGVSTKPADGALVRLKRRTA